MLGIWIWHLDSQIVFFDGSRRPRSEFNISGLMLLCCSANFESVPGRYSQFFVCPGPDAGLQAQYQSVSLQ